MKKALKKIQDETGIIENIQNLTHVSHGPHCAQRFHGAAECDCGNAEKVCPHCDGNREEPGAPENEDGTALCSVCSGTGKVAADYDPEEPAEKLMQDIGHTPGPWGTSRDATPAWHTQITVYAESDGERIATVFRTVHNASLIAAAPDLLDALTALYNSAPAPKKANAALWEAIQLTRAAIAKAKGQQ